MGDQNGLSPFPYEFKELEPEVKAEITRLYKCKYIFCILLQFRIKKYGTNFRNLYVDRNHQ